MFTKIMFKGGHKMFNLRIYFTIFVLTGITTLAGLWDYALAGGPPPMGQCGIGIGKVAFGGEGLEFPFEITVDGNGPNSTIIIGGDGTGGPFNSEVTVTELPLEGWELVDIECEGEGGISFDISEDSFTAICTGSGGGTCTFFNRSIAAIPTLSDWGMIAAAAGLGLVGVLYVIRRKRAAA
ncbi:MAG: IPTL-CTERM sorting domain-containing protein [Thermodesulfobacteriota bacterium]